ncbi:MAG: RecQ family ATP-dependent DNA helicase [Flavobacteriaceae bacterium]|nr:RecQ family ATP-dependent DNA helicase [Flavobacteriaceae bacterium]
MTSPLHILQTYWHYPNFRPTQEKIIEAVLLGRDTVALLPTGGGKSICFQVPAMVMEGICIVVSPLVALMTDQVQGLMTRGIKAMAITGGISGDELTTQLDNALFGNYKFLYLSPERLQQEQVQVAIQKMSVNLIAIDEAHCISQWGNDFRPSYLHIAILRELQPYVPIIALTASATQEVLADTIVQLKLEAPLVFKDSFARSNISYLVEKTSDKVYRTTQLLKNNPQSAIVYVRSRKQAEEFCRRLQNEGITASFYHGGLAPKEKNDRLNQWKKDLISTIVATNAFGMGIDHPSVRYVVHTQLPESIESYFQEAGRAGRDGKEATALVLYDENDKQLVKKQFIDTLPSFQDIKDLYRTLTNYFQVAYGEGEFTEHSFNFATFCDTYKLNALLTFNGLNTLDRLGVIQLSKQFGRKSKLQFLVSSSQLLAEFENHPTFSIVGKTILRIYGGIFDSQNTINLDLVSNKSGLEVNAIISVLKEMEQRQLMTLKLYETDASITFLVPREDERTLNPFRTEIISLNEKKKQQVTAVLNYIENQSTCKASQLLAYFGEEAEKDCGHCSVCKNKSYGTTAVGINTLSEKILALLAIEPMDSRTLLENLLYPEEEVLKTLRILLDKKMIQLNAINQYFCTL